MSDVDDYAVVDSTNGDLTGNPVQSAALNLTYNVSLACFTQALRGQREWSEFEHCLELLVSVFSLKNVRIMGWPFEYLFPWEDPSVLDDDAAAPAAPSALASHVDDHTHYDTATVAGIDLFGFLIAAAFLSLLLGLCATDGYYYYYSPSPARERAYRKVEPA